MRRQRRQAAQAVRRRYEALRRELDRWRAPASSPRGPLGRLAQWLRQGIWEPPTPRGAPALAVRLVRVLVLFARGFRNERLTVHAAALTYRLLLTLAPLLAVAFSVFELLGGLEQAAARVRALLLEYLAPGFGEQVEQQLERFVAAVQQSAAAGSVLAALALAWTVTSALAALERTLHGIFGAQLRRRQRLGRLFVYWAVALLAPLLVGTSLVLTASLASSGVAAWLQARLPVVVELVVRAAPAVLGCAGFTLLYRLLAGVAVRWREALAGGVVAGLGFELGKRAFAASAGELIASRHAVYGALGVLFVFLFWIYISWLIFLVGAQVVAAARAAGRWRDDELAERAAPRLREELGVRLVWRLAAAARSGAPGLEPQAAARALGVPEALVLRVLAELELAGLVRPADGQQRAAPPRFALARAPEELTPAHVLAALAEGGAAGLVPAPAAGAEARVLALLDGARAAAWAQLAERSFASLLGAAEDPDGSDTAVAGG
ncbi:MAG: hypothetical protein KatS3mg102_1466 [Planctomycetota bacterium]|nr:MAG: hypothetical protein KatS3mg102_1466 [Planctomycetota bacterium]